MPMNGRFSDVFAGIFISSKWSRVNRFGLPVLSLVRKTYLRFVLVVFVGQLTGFTVIGDSSLLPPVGACQELSGFETDIADFATGNGPGTFPDARTIDLSPMGCSLPQCRMGAQLMCRPGWWVGSVAQALSLAQMQVVVCCD